MLMLNEQVFDEIIEGTTTTWYTSARYNELLGRPRSLRIIASARDVTSSGTLQVFVDSSIDNQHWYEPTTPVITKVLSVGSDIAEGSSQADGAFQRLRIKFSTGTTPRCWLQLGVSGRSL
jgi:hypothetical protein